MMHILDCILKKKQPEDKMLYLDPFDLFDWYKAEYPLRSDEVYEDSDHKYIKMLLKLRREGIELAVSTFLVMLIELINLLVEFVVPPD